MKFEPPINANYAATVVKLKNIIPLAGCDNVVGTTIFGFQAIISNSHKKGDIGLAFTAETQISDAYCHENNLYRHDDKNKNLGVKGYLEDNRRVKAMKFRGHQSDCLFMPLESLKYTGINIEELSEGDTFDKIGDQIICQKYVIRTNESLNRLDKNRDKTFKRVESKFMPEHYDSDNYFRNADTISPEQDVIVTQKLHGTSIRVANTIVKRKLSMVENFLKKMGVKIQEYEYDNVYGSRKVVKDINNPNQNHFYKIDVWSEEGKKLDGLLPEGYILYGELIGYTADGAALQKNYTYGFPVGTCGLYVYRVAFINHQGIIVDLSWNQVKEFCIERGLNFVPELYLGKMKDLVVEDWLNKRYWEAGFKNCLPLPENEKLVDEGICIRVDRLAPYILKAKSPIFLEHESQVLDEGLVDLESQESQPDA